MWWFSSCGYGNECWVLMQVFGSNQCLAWSFFPWHLVGGTGAGVDPSLCRIAFQGAGWTSLFDWLPVPAANKSIQGCEVLGCQPYGDWHSWSYKRPPSWVPPTCPSIALWWQQSPSIPLCITILHWITGLYRLQSTYVFGCLWSSWMP